MKIRSSGLSGSTLSRGQSQSAPVSVWSHPMAALLFGERPPRLVDKRKYPKLRRGLARLSDMAEHISTVLGRRRNEFDLELCEGDNASISREGQIAFGVELMDEHQDDDDLMLGILGHEMGHRPWTWPTIDLSHLTPTQLSALYREEEKKADLFAGRVLADLQGSPKAIERFLLEHAKGFEQAHQSSNDYYPPAVRVAMIREAFDRRQRLKRGAVHLLGIR